MDRRTWARTAGLLALGLISATGVWAEEVPLISGTEQDPPISATATPCATKRAADGSCRIKVDGARYQMGLGPLAAAQHLQQCEVSGSTRCTKKQLKGELGPRFVEVQPFLLDPYEVSETSYARCVEAGVCTAIDAAACSIYDRLDWGTGRELSSQPEGSPQRCVIREEARTYCEWAGGRLPNEAEWELAAGGVDKRVYPWGADWTAAKDVVIHVEPDARLATNAQRTDSRTPAGVENLAGNVYEWVDDDECEHAERPETGPCRKGKKSKGVVRGGSFVSDPTTARTTARKAVAVDARTFTSGFRCAADPVAEPPAVAGIAQAWGGSGCGSVLYADRTRIMVENLCDHTTQVVVTAEGDITQWLAYADAITVVAKLEGEGRFRPTTHFLDGREAVWPLIKFREWQELAWLVHPVMESHVKLSREGISVRAAIDERDVDWESDEWARVEDEVGMQMDKYGWSETTRVIPAPDTVKLRADFEVAYVPASLCSALPVEVSQQGELEVATIKLDKKAVEIGRTEPHWGESIKVKQLCGLNLVRVERFSSGTSGWSASVELFGSDLLTSRIAYEDSGSNDDSGLQGVNVTRDGRYLVLLRNKADLLFDVENAEEVQFGRVEVRCKKDSDCEEQVSPECKASTDPDCQASGQCVIYTSEDSPEQSGTCGGYRTVKPRRFLYLP